MTELISGENSEYSLRGPFQLIKEKPEIKPGDILLPKALDVFSDHLVKKQKVIFAASDTQNTTDDQSNDSRELQWSPKAANEGFEPTFEQYTDKIVEAIETR